MRFVEKLLSASRKNNSLVCVGLDTDVAKIPKFLLREDDPTFAFNRNIIDSTSDLVCAYKPNIAFYEALGSRGWDALKKTCEAVPKEIPIILDAKRGDIDNTAKMYARAFFEVLKVDAVTISPYLGKDAILPFLDYADKCAFILCLTSNEGAKDFQLSLIEKKPLYEIVAEKVLSWNKEENCGLVVGATYPEQLKRIRDRYILAFSDPWCGSTSRRNRIYREIWHGQKWGVGNNKLISCHSLCFRWGGFCSSSKE